MTRTLLVALSLYAAATALAACPDGGCPAPGGGPAVSDCLVEYDGVAPADGVVRCTDGDPSCDTDGVPNGGCRFTVRACLNVADPRLPRCTAPSVASYRLRNGRPGRRRFDPALASLETAVRDLLPATASTCTDAVPLFVPLRGTRSFRPTHLRLRSQARGARGPRDTDRVRLTCVPSPTFGRPDTGFTRAAVIAHPAQLIDGPLSRGRLGDVLLVNDRIQVVIQQPGRAMFGIGTYGGTIIDADRRRPDGEERDHFEEIVPAINVENTANFTSVQIVNDGADGAPAVVRATGPDDLLDFINASSVVASVGFVFPASADDRDLPVEVQTDYILAPGADYVRMETTVTNVGGAALDLFLGETLNGSGEVDLFQAAYGFGQPLVTTGCPAATWVPCASGTCDPCNLVAYSGVGSARGLSYGYVHDQNGSSSFSVSGVTVTLFGNQVLLVLIGAATPNFHLAAAGSPGDAATVTRWFVVGNGDVGDVTDVRNDVQQVTTGRVFGTVTAGGEPLAGADVAVLGAPVPNGPARNVVTHFHTGADGRYEGTLAPGSYTLRANRDGHRFGLPDPAPVTIVAGGAAEQNFTLPDAGHLRVQVTDAAGAPIPARVFVLGFDPSPEPGNPQDVFGVIDNFTGVFSEVREDGLPYGLAVSAVADRHGDTGLLDVEPGSYQVAVSRGTRWSLVTTPVTVTAGATATVTAQLAQVVETPGFITGEFHIHALPSPDSEVALVDRIATQLAEGIDFFTPSEHDIRVDFAPTVDAMGVADLIATAPSAEITTFDYGHFNSWPVTVDPTQVNGGSVDWGGSAAPGADFPSLGSYSLTPREIFAAAHADPRPNIVQINHIDSFFGIGQSGLDIDTAENGTGPPQSHTPGTAVRLDPSVSNYFDAGFDALEVWNGSVALFLGQNIGDWFNLLNQGLLRTAVANSDSHERRTNGGSVRTYVASAVTDPGLLRDHADTLAANVVAGRASGTNGPFVTTSLHAVSTGQTATLALGAPTVLATSDGAVDLTVTVRSPHWAEFDRIELYVNNAPQPYDHDGNAATRRKYRVIPDRVVTKGADFAVTSVPGGVAGASRLEATVTVPLAGLTEDIWIVALVRGTDGISRPLFPVLPFGISPATNTTPEQLVDGNLGEGGEVALAFTNALYVDVDGGGWSAPGVRLTPP